MSKPSFLHLFTPVCSFSNAVAGALFGPDSHSRNRYGSNPVPTTSKPLDPPPGIPNLDKIEAHIKATHAENMRLRLENERLLFIISETRRELSEALAHLRGQ